MSYFQNKIDRIKKANEHTKYVEEKYKDEIKKSVNETKTYIHSPIEKYNEERTKFGAKLWGTDSVSAIIKASNELLDKSENGGKVGKDGKKEKIAVLNFASYKHAGGMFLQGSSAQEESLCHESNLYNILTSFKNTYYKTNSLYTYDNLYLDKALYTPNVVFERDNKAYLCDVITCAAPNKKAGQQYCNVTDEQNSKALRSRIKFVLDIAEYEKVDVLILGAYGAGVFGQDPTEVAKTFVHYLRNNNYSFKYVVFAVPTRTNNQLNNNSIDLKDKFNQNYLAFKTVLSQYSKSKDKF